MWRRTLGIVVCLIGLIGMGVFCYSQSQSFMSSAAQLISHEATAALQTEIKIDKISLSSFTKVQAENIEVFDKTGHTLATAAVVEIRFNPWKIVTGEPAIENVRRIDVKQGSINLVQNENGTWNYQDIIKNDSDEKNVFAGVVALDDTNVTISTSGHVIDLNRLKGTIDFAAQPALAFDLKFVHNAGEAAVSGSLGGKNEAFSIKATNFDLADYLDLLPDDMAVKVKQGLLKSLDVTVLKTDGEYKVSGETLIVGAALDVKGTAVEKIDGLVLFNEKDLRIFSRGMIKNQPVVLRGTMSLDVVEPLLDLQIDSKGFDAATVLTNFPLVGKIAFSANIKGRYSDPTIEGSFTMAEGRIYDKTLHNLSAKLKFVDSLLTIKSAETEIAGGKISAQGQVVASDLSYYLHVKASGVSTDPFAEYLVGLSGSANGDVVIVGQGSDFSTANIYGSAAIYDGSYQRMPFQRANVNFAKSAATTTIDNLSIILPQGELVASGSINGDQIAMDFSGGQIELAQFAAVNPSVKVSGLANVKGTINGSLTSPVAEVDLSAENGAIYGQPYQLASGRLSLIDNQLSTMDFKINNGKGEHRVSGSVGLAGDNPVSLAVVSQNIRVEDIVKEFLPEEKLTGNVNNTLNVSGTLDNLAVQGEMDFFEGSFRGVFLTKAHGKYSYQDGGLLLQDFVVSAPNLNVKLNGLLKPDSSMDFDIIADEVNFAKLRLNLPYPVSGIGNFAGKLSGTTDQPAFHGKINAADLVFNDQQVKDVHGEVNYRNGNLDLTAFSFKLGDGKINITSGINLDNKQMHGKLTVEKASVAGLLALFNLKNQWISGDLDGIIKLGGTVDSPNIRLIGVLPEGELKNYPLKNIAVDLGLDGTLLTVNKFRAEQGAGLLVAKGTLDMQGPLELEFAGKSIDAGLITNLADYKLATQGTLDFGAQISGTAKNPVVNLSTEISNGGVGTATFDSLYGLFRLEDGIINVEQLMLRKDQYKASAYGIVPLAALQGSANYTDVKNQMNLKISLDHADLSILPFLSKEIDWASGETAGGVNITGTLANPLVNGNVLVKNGAIKFVSLGKPLQNIEFDLEFSGDRLALRSFTGIMGSGSYQMSGYSSLTGQGLTNYDFNLNLDKLEVVNDYYKGPLQGELHLTEDRTHKQPIPKIAGVLKFDNCTVDIPTLPESESAMPLIKMDLEVLLGKKVRLYNQYFYDIWLDGRAKFEGTTYRPQSSGEITAIRGTVNYLKTPFKIREASAYFNQVGSFLPSLHLEADTRLQRTKVYLQVNGPADKMQIRLKSDPEMNESEIMSLLTLRSRYFDKNKEGNSGIGRDELVSLLDMGLQMSFLSEMENMMRSALGLDEFKVVRDTLELNNKGRSYNEEVYNIEIGKYVSDKLMLRYVQGVDYNSYKYGIRYEFNSKISLMGDVDEKQHSTIGIEARFKF